MNTIHPFAKSGRIFCYQPLLQINYQKEFTFEQLKTKINKLKLTAMPSFDIVSKVDAQALDNAVNIVTKEITNRFDFKGSHVVINLDKKEFQIKLETDDDMKMRQLIDVLISRAHKQGIAPEAFDASKGGAQSGKVWKKEVKVRNGLIQEDAKKVVKLIKDAGLKVQASINDDLVRVTGKKIDDLQDVIQLCKNGNLGIPLQYVNMRD
jgi:cyclic-di-GMP-binding protein